ncbi:MAG: enoyl-CoA hydratase/isomerase family protein [Arenicellales bacterium]
MRTHFDTILVENEDHLAWVKLNRPEVANAFNTRMAEELLEVFSEFVSGTREARCIILTGVGERAFCAGGDLKQRNGMTDDAWFAQHLVFEELARALMDAPVPLIGAINGAAYGGGTELTLACDFAYAATHARFALTETTLGIMPGMAGTQYLPRSVGVRRAKEIILSGAPFDAQQALAWGLVNEVCEPTELLGAVRKVALRIASNGPLAVRAALRAMNHAEFSNLKADYEAELAAYNELVPTEDRREGILAFNEKRRANFKGR